MLHVNCVSTQVCHVCLGFNIHSRTFAPMLYLSFVERVIVSVLFFGILFKENVECDGMTISIHILIV